MKSLLMAVLFVGVAAQAQSNYKGSSEASAIVVNGTATPSSTYSLKTKNMYTLDEVSAVTGFGSYVLGTTGSGANEVKSSDSLNLGARYDYTITKDVFGVFAQAQYDKELGYDHKLSYDLGVKYVFLTNSTTHWFGEVGYRHADQKNLDGSTASLDYGRLYTEVTQKLTETANAKLWVEYLPGLNDKTANALNAEASVSVAMSSVLALKTGLLLNHYDEKATAGVMKSDKTTWTTSLVANY